MTISRKTMLLIKYLNLSQAYVEAVLALKPMAYYLLNTTTGTSVLDMSRNGNTATISGGVTLGLSGPILQSLAMGFNGSSGEIVTPLDPSWSSGTILFWMITTNSNPQSIAGNRSGGMSFEVGINANGGNNFGTSVAGSITAFINGNNVYESMQSQASFTDGNWHCVAASFNGTSGSSISPSNFTLCVDGALLTSTDVYDGTGQATAPIQGGSGYTIASSSFDGSLAHLAFLPGVLSVSAAANLYALGTATI